MNREKMILATASFALVLVFVASCLAWPGCTDTCGNLTNIPYPFRIGHRCFLDPWYEIDCQRTGGISTPILENLGVVVLKIGLPESSNTLGHIRVSQPILYSNLNCTTNRQKDAPVDLRSSNGVFRFSRNRNYFVAGSCDNQALMTTNDAAGNIVGCKSSCRGDRILGFNQCANGTGCCVTSIVTDIVKYKVEFKTSEGKDLARGDSNCRYAFLVEQGWLHTAHLRRLPQDVPVMLEWAITQYEEQLLSKQNNSLANGNSGSCHEDVRPGLAILLYCSCREVQRGSEPLPPREVRESIGIIRLRRPQGHHHYECMAQLSKKF
ncbi:hypothetical protein EUGRSUZ_E03106 [Eucalyptus grandis]|uniref:Uncharacterized protein n=2 Tax=Eucalyptus grandis TaxID=71139 RepID=A0ACC3KYQ4_EUCGR|nr:hypothetical protein EUGRSUZ_E03106 [Eucalyptus grandis]